MDNITFDDNGFMLHPQLWNEDLAQTIAAEDGVVMSEKHWTVIRFIRTWYEKKGNAPMVRLLCKETGLTIAQIYELFPYGPARSACRIAGLPKPEGCV